MKTKIKSRQDADAEVWDQKRTLSPDTANHRTNSGLPDGANTLFADGHVEYLKTTIGESWEVIQLNHYWSPKFAKPAASNVMTAYP